MNWYLLQNTTNSLLLKNLQNYCFGRENKNKSRSSQTRLKIKSNFINYPKSRSFYEFLSCQNDSLLCNSDIFARWGENSERFIDWNFLHNNQSSLFRKTLPKRKKLKKKIQNNWTQCRRPRNDTVKFSVSKIVSTPVIFEPFFFLFLTAEQNIFILSKSNGLLSHIPNSFIFFPWPSLLHNAQQLGDGPKRPPCCSFNPKCHCQEHCLHLKIHLAGIFALFEKRSARELMNDFYFRHPFFSEPWFD